MIAIMLPQQRYELILRSLRADGPAAVKTLADRLGVSHATVRRDLVQLDREGRLQRVYGGAVSAADVDEPFAEVATVRVQEKDAIAARCAELIKDGDTILLDIGTTAHRLARTLHGRALTVITSNLAVYEELVDDADIQLILLGGVVRRSYRSLVGFLTEDALRQIHADRLFLSTSGIRPDGQVMDTTVVEVTIKRAMIAASDQVILLADATKFPGTGVGRVCGPEALGVVVTSAGADPTTCRALTDVGVEVISA
jgi:DeoR/GlpR family transcriptional regulator of sugar metabolism